jgi:hypothetical protein
MRLDAKRAMAGAGPPGRRPGEVAARGLAALGKMADHFRATARKMIRCHAFLGMRALPDGSHRFEKPDSPLASANRSTSDDMWFRKP